MRKPAVTLILMSLCATLLFGMSSTFSPSWNEDGEDSLSDVEIQEKGTKGPDCIPLKTLDVRKLAYQSGERLEYAVHYKWGMINADVGYGKVSLDTLNLNGTQAFHCRVYGKTAKFYDSFFRVREDFNSWFSCEGLRPIRFMRDSREGNYFATNFYRYRWTDEPYIQAELDNKRRGRRTMEIPITSCTYDLPSLFFMARNMDFGKIVPNEKNPMTFVIDDDVYNVYFIMIGPENKVVKGLGTVKTIKFAAQLVKGEVFGSEDDMYLWISDDDNRIPICFEAPLKYGVASGRLISYEGLKHKFSSIVKR